MGVKEFGILRQHGAEQDLTFLPNYNLEQISMTSFSMSSRLVSVVLEAAPGLSLLRSSGWSKPWQLASPCPLLLGGGSACEC